MNIDEIHEAAMNGRTFRVTGKLEQFSFENGTLKLDWVFPDAGKPFNLNHDFTYIELAPKYDPCRLFRKGDIVDVKPSVGKRPQFLYLEEDETHGDGHWVVQSDEECGEVRICYNGERCARVWYNMLELVTPVEELEPYYIEETEYEFCVTIMIGERKDSPAIYHKRMHPHAKEAAEAECARLNEEYKTKNIKEN